MPEYLVDRLWPDPATDLPLDDAMAGFAPPVPPPGRPAVALNMVTTIDGRAQRAGTAEGLAGRADRRLMRLYRARFDAVASGVGTLRQAGLWLRVGDDLAARRVAEGRPPNPTGVVIAGSQPVPTRGSWYEGDEARILVVGAGSPVTGLPDGTELLRAPDALPDPRWVLDALAERGIGSVLLEGGPHLNAAFIGAGLVDELYWTVGAHVMPTDALPMVAPLAPDSAAVRPLPATLMSVLRHGDELFVRYRLADAGR